MHDVKRPLWMWGRERVNQARPARGVVTYMAEGLIPQHASLAAVALEVTFWHQMARVLMHVTLHSPQAVYAQMQGARVTISADIRRLV